MGGFRQQIWAHECPIITTLSKYYEEIGETAFDPNEEYTEAEMIICKILSLDFCLWFLRRTSGDACDGSAFDDLKSLKDELKLKHENLFGHPYFDINAETIY